MTRLDFVWKALNLDKKVKIADKKVKTFLVNFEFGEVQDWI